MLGGIHACNGCCHGDGVDRRRGVCGSEAHPEGNPDRVLRRQAVHRRNDVRHQVQDDVRGRRQGDARTQDKAGQKGEGSWKLSKDGFCTTWQSKTATCYTLVNVEKNKWSVVKGATTVAVWSK